MSEIEDFFLSSSVFKLLLHDMPLIQELQWECGAVMNISKHFADPDLQQQNGTMMVMMHRVDFKGPKDCILKLQAKLLSLQESSPRLPVDDNDEEEEQERLSCCIIDERLTKCFDEDESSEIPHKEALEKYGIKNWKTPPFISSSSFSSKSVSPMPSREPSFGAEKNEDEGNDGSPGVGNGIYAGAGGGTGIGIGTDSWPGGSAIKSAFVRAVGGGWKFEYQGSDPLSVSVEATEDNMDQTFVRLIQYVGFHDGSGYAYAHGTLFKLLNSCKVKCCWKNLSQIEIDSFDASVSEDCRKFQLEIDALYNFCRNERKDAFGMHKRELGQAERHIWTTQPGHFFKVVTALTRHLQDGNDILSSLAESIKFLPPGSDEDSISDKLQEIVHQCTSKNVQLRVRIIESRLDYLRDYMSLYKPTNLGEEKFEKRDFKVKEDDAFPVCLYFNLPDVDKSDPKPYDPKHAVDRTKYDQIQLSAMEQAETGGGFDALKRHQEDGDGKWIVPTIDKDIVVLQSDAGSSYAGGFGYLWSNMGQLLINSNYNWASKCFPDSVIPFIRRKLGSASHVITCSLCTFFGYNSSQMELYALLDFCVNHMKDNTRVCWINDNKVLVEMVKREMKLASVGNRAFRNNVCSVCNKLFNLCDDPVHKDSKRTSVQQLISTGNFMEALQECLFLKKCELLPRWVPRGLNSRADRLSHIAAIYREEDEDGLYHDGLYRKVTVENSNHCFPICAFFLPPPLPLDKSSAAVNTIQSHIDALVAFIRDEGDDHAEGKYILTIPCAKAPDLARFYASYEPLSDKVKRVALGWNYIKAVKQSNGLLHIIGLNIAGEEKEAILTNVASKHAKEDHSSPVKVKTPEGTMKSDKSGGRTAAVTIDPHIDALVAFIRDEGDDHAEGKYILTIPCANAPDLARFYASYEPLSDPAKRVALGWNSCKVTKQSKGRLKADIRVIEGKERKIITALW